MLFCIIKIQTMFKYDIIINPNFEINKNIINNIFLQISQNINTPQNWILNIIFVWEDDIKELNNNYRQKDYTTDVLSFHYFDDFSQLNQEEIAWELVFCESKILSQSVEYWLGIQKEFYKLLIHSILHILWYDHEIDEDFKMMKIKEDLIWNLVFN